MTGKQPRDMSASVRARLMNIAKRNNEAFDLVLVRFAIERLLYRLSQSKYRDRFVVKGAMMFQVWSNLNHRPTRDLDLLGTGEPDVDRFVEIFCEVCVQEVENDGLVFVVDSVFATKMKEDEEYEGIRIKFDALLGAARIPVQVDVGFGDAITPSSQLIVFPTVLELPALNAFSWRLAYRLRRDRLDLPERRSIGTALKMSASICSITRKVLDQTKRRGEISAVTRNQRVQACLIWCRDDLGCGFPGL